MSRKSARLETTVDLPPLSIRADVASINDEDRTVELIFSTGAAVDRMDWFSGRRFIEKLSLDPKHVRLERLNAGGPLLDSHSAWSVSDQLGAIVPGTVRLTKSDARATVRFSRREQVEPIWQDVRDGIIRSVSVGYRVHKFEEDASKENKVPTRTAVDWEPYEVSMVSMPADAGAKTRGEQRGDLNQCVVVTRAEGSTMSDQHTSGQSEYLDEQQGQVNQRLGLAEETRATETVEPTAADVAAKTERERVQGILTACRAARMPSSMFDTLVAEGVPLVDAQRRIFVEMSKRADPQPNGGPNAGARRVEMGDDPMIHKRAGIQNALLHRVNPNHFKLEEVGREYRGMSILDIAKAFLQARGERITDLSRMEIAGMALGLVHTRGGMHTTSDFPLLLADVANKSLRADYEAAPQTFMPITRIGSVPDFKAANRVQIGDAPALHPVGEHGEYTRGTIEEGREQVQAASYGRVFAITRKALINDDLDAFSRVPTKFGRMARNLESDLVWYQILKNANMADGNALFSAAHLNYAGAGDISVANVGAAEKAMLLQRGLDATTLISVQPKLLIVPPTKKVRAEQFVSTTLQAATQANVNPFAGMLTVLCEPRLEAGITIGSGVTTLTATGSAHAWYLAALASQIDIIELVFLEGQQGPVIESRIGFDIDGLEIKCREDVGAKVIDHRGLWKSDGTESS